MEKLQLSHIGQLVKLPKKLLEFEPTHASRYWILANVLTALGAHQKAKILDVGGKKGLLSSFPGFSPTIIDMEDSDEPKFIKGDALNMPFKDGEFEYAVSCDVLEHIPKKDRAQFLLEMLRVSSKGAVLCAPFDNPGNSELEQKMNDYYAHLTGKQHRWLREHIDNGLPNESEVEKTLQKHGYEFVKFRHFSGAVWQSIVGQHLLHAAFGDSEQLGSVIRQVYKDYYRKLCSVDFSDDGYRTFFWISKKGRPQIVLPGAAETQKAREAFFAANELLLLGLVESGLQDRRAHAQLIQKAKVQRKLLTQTQKDLEQTREELLTIKNSPAWKALHRVRLIVKPDKAVNSKKTQK